MKKKLGKIDLIHFICLAVFSSSIVFAADNTETSPAQKKVKILYKKHSEVNLTGNTVKGKTRVPEVIYIFQRKRSQGHQVIQPPNNFQNHKQLTQKILQESVLL